MPELREKGAGVAVVIVTRMRTATARSTLGLAPHRMSEMRNPADRILFHEYGTELRLGEGDALILNVLCGRIAEFGVEFPLNEQERDAYRRRGDAYIQELSRLVQGDWQPYAARGRTC
jgi:hypothetical protein